jgi:hypothetical protein
VTRPRFQADADFNHKVILGLRRREATIDFQDAHAGRVIGLPDIEVLSIAAKMGRILVSHDRSTMPGHFAQFLATRHSPGLIIVDQDLDIGRAIEELFLIWVATEIEEWQDKIGYVPI